MPIRYLLDENLPPKYRTQLLRKQPDLTVWIVGDPAAPPKGTLDPEILNWCEKNGSILVTSNRRSMPTHLSEHLAAGRHVQGILVLRLKARLGEILDDLVLIAAASYENEYQDRIVYVPLT